MITVNFKKETSGASIFEDGELTVSTTAAFTFEHLGSGIKLSSGSFSKIYLSKDCNFEVSDVPHVGTLTQLINTLREIGRAHV